MPKVYEADITELVKPHYEKGLQEGEFKAKIETAKKMKKEGLSLDLIIKITGLSKKDLKKHGIIS